MTFREAVAGNQAFRPIGPAGCLTAGPQPNADPVAARELEAAFDAIAENWWEIASELSNESSAALSHTPACAPNASDFGLMLAWTRIVDGWAAAPETHAVACDDPWLFRHLAGRPGVVASKPPAYLGTALKLAVRGFMARTRVALSVTMQAIRLRRPSRQTGGAALLVYGHPSSTEEGDDGYFGDLMRRQPGLRRVLHVDCPASRARALKGDGRTDALHAWGSPVFAATLPFAVWHPAARHRRGAHAWLIRRAAAREGGTGQPAMIRWQLHCQKRWLEAARPKVVAWPWENHAWERAFVATARRSGVRTIGYQHSVVGRQMLNYAPASSPDGLQSVPDQVLCTGAATRDQLALWRIPGDRLRIAGALRFREKPAVECRPDGPVFLALPFDGAVAVEMVDAAQRAAASGNRFIVKDHPMTPFPFDGSEAVRRTSEALEDQESVSAVVFAATTVGLESVLMGLPTLRFQPTGRISIDVLPSGISVPTTSSVSLSDDLAELKVPPTLGRDAVFAAVDYDSWSELLKAENT